MNKTEILNNLEWQGNSKKMYGLIIKSIPPIFTNSVKNKIANWIFVNNIHIVTEEVLYKAVDEIAPLNIANQIKSQLNNVKL